MPEWTIYDRLLWGWLSWQQQFVPLARVTTLDVASNVSLDAWPVQVLVHCS
jgi:hypothetical protein